MEILGWIAVIFMIILILVSIFLPSIAMFFGLSWVSKNKFPKKNRWVRWSGVLLVLFITPQILNKVIERDVQKVVAQSHGVPPHYIGTPVIAVQTHYKEHCKSDCVSLLLSGKVEQYLIVQYPTENTNPKVTAYRFEENSECSHIDIFDKSRLSAKLESTVRLLSLSGTCLTTRDAKLDIADLLVTFDKVPKPSWFTPSVRGYQISISQKGSRIGEWEEIYRDIGLKYGQVSKILLPTFTLVKNRPPIDVVRRPMFWSPAGKVACKEDWFSDQEACYRQLRRKPVSEILGLSVSEYNLEKSGIIRNKTERAETLSNLIETIISEERIPTPNEWAMINRFISSEYHESEAITELVLNVMSHSKFPVPQLAYGGLKLSNEQKSQLANAVINRIGNDIPGPDIGKSTEKQQWRNLYRIVKELPADFLDPHFEELVDAVLLRANKKQNVEFFEKFGPRSRQPILDILVADKKRLKSLSSVMCKMGSELSGIEDPLMKMAESHQISLRGNNGKIIYFLMDLGIDENRLLNTVDQSTHYADNYTNSITQSIKKYKSGKKYC